MPIGAPLCILSLSALALVLPALHAQDTPSALLNKQLPKWVQFSFDHRFRLEGYSALRYDQNNNDRWLLNRFRANVALHPTSWLSFAAQGQDSRVFFKTNPSGQNTYTNRTDLRLLFTDIGKTDRGKIALRLGRQELAYGDERVLGAANWGNVARTFDAAKLILRSGPFQLDLVSAAVVTPLANGLSHHLQGNNIHFAYGKWNNPIPQSTLEPYFIWRVGKGAGDSLKGIIHQDRRVAGIRFLGKLPAHWDYTTEWIFQAGNVNGPFGYESIRAFAQHTVFRHSFENVRFHPRVLGEFNSASGDRNPNDGKSGTFDQLFPTPHEKYGLADQVGWQNIQHYSGGADITPYKGLTLKMLVHDWYLAQARDGVYTAGGNLLFRDTTGNSGRHVGEELDFVAQYSFGPHYVGTGYGHLFPGHFLEKQSRGVGLNYIYLNVGYRF